MILPPEAVRRRINRVQALIAYLERLNCVDLPAYRKDIALQLRVERVVQLLAQTLVDVGMSIAERKQQFDSPRQGRPAVESGPLFQRLSAAGVVPADLAGRLADLPDLAEILAHEHVEIDPRDVWGVWRDRLPDFVALTATYVAYLAKHKGIFQ